MQDAAPDTVAARRPRWEWPQKYLRVRLSTLFLLTAISALAIGWYVDHYRITRSDIVGTWHYPNDDFCMTGYWTDLTICADRTFEKKQEGRYGSTTFRGTYTPHENGIVYFHITSMINETMLDNLKVDGKVLREPQETTVDVTYTCRCAVDPSGYLLVGEVNPLKRLSSTSIGFHWDGSYAPSRQQSLRFGKTEIKRPI